ncbi:hypothetical protein LCGC14_0263800 [marine sediment metagenome]|uniref:Uncharacterized protein n=1 Tax=marine sediment metagenome TaxID=412755 RepID=A0A0F9WLC3_9ZZZZ
MKHLIRATLSNVQVYAHCGLTLDRHDSNNSVRVCLPCIRGKQDYNRRVQASYNELSFRGSTVISPFTRD